MSSINIENLSGIKLSSPIDIRNEKSSSLNEYKIFLKVTMFKSIVFLATLPTIYESHDY